MAARAFGADWTRFSVHGSTHPNQALCLTAAHEGQKVIVARTSHKSVMAGLVLSGAEPVWVAPEVDESSGLALAVPLAQIEDGVRAGARRARGDAGRAVLPRASSRTSRRSPSSCTPTACR